MPERSDTSRVLRRSVWPRAALVLGIASAAVPAAQAQDSAPSPQDNNPIALDGDSIATAQRAARAACQQLTPFLERAIADSIHTLRRQGKLQAVVDSMYALYSQTQTIAVRIPPTSLPDSVRPLAAAAGPGCRPQNVGALVALIQPELTRAMQGPASPANTTADSAAPPTP